MIFFSIIFTEKIDNSYKIKSGIAKPICVTGSGGVSTAAAALLTPPDPITQIGLAIPLLILYELSIFSVKFIESKNLKDSDA